MTGLLERLRFHRDHRFTMAHASEYLDGELNPGARSACTTTPGSARNAASCSRRCDGPSTGLPACAAAATTG